MAGPGLDERESEWILTPKGLRSHGLTNESPWTQNEITGFAHQTRAPLQTVRFSGETLTLGPMLPPRMSLHRAFVADHFHDLPGFVEARHGHNWELEATVNLEETHPEPALAQALDAWVKSIDYTLLNDQPWLKNRNPTAEALAQWLLEALEERGFSSVETRIREKANYWAACHRESA